MHIDLNFLMVLSFIHEWFCKNLHIWLALNEHVFLRPSALIYWQLIRIYGCVTRTTSTLKSEHISQIPQCISPISHIVPFVHITRCTTCAHFCNKMVHYWMWDWWIVGSLCSGVHSQKDTFRKLGAKFWSENRRHLKKVVALRKKPMSKYFNNKCRNHDKSFSQTISRFFSDKKFRNGSNSILRENDNTIVVSRKISKVFNDYFQVLPLISVSPMSIFLPAKLLLLIKITWV